MKKRKFRTRETTSIGAAIRRGPRPSVAPPSVPMTPVVAAPEPKPEAVPEPVERDESTSIEVIKDEAAAPKPKTKRKRKKRDE